MGLLLGNGKVVTRDPEQPYLTEGCLYIEEGLIQEVGATASLRSKYPQAQWFDAKGKVIMPGLINVHHHIYSAFARGLSIDGYAPKTFNDILEGMWWKIDRLLTLEDCRYSAYATYLNCIRNGVTTVFDHHASYGAIEGSLSAISGVAKELGVRTCLCFEVSDRDGKAKAEEAIRENAEFIRACTWDDSDMLYGMMGLHAAFTLSDETLKLCARYRGGAGFHIHVAEAISDVQDSLSKYGKRVVNRLYDLDLLGPKTLAVHCVHINREEMRLLKETDTMVAHNPESNMGNAVGCEPMLQIFNEGILLGLGTDGYTSDMIESYKVANILHKHNLGDPAAAWGEAPAMLFDNNARIANRYFRKPLGILREGAAADVIVCDYDPLTPMDAGNVNSHILFGMNGYSVTDTIVAGRIIMRNRVIADVDEEALMAESRRLAASLWKRVNG
jgi:putative selenium metabolism protein SsnA